MMMNASTTVTLMTTMMLLTVVFHLWDRLRFQNAIWHAFVLAGAACHYVAIVDFLPPLAG